MISWWNSHVERLLPGSTKCPSEDKLLCPASSSLNSPEVISCRPRMHRWLTQRPISPGQLPQLIELGLILFSPWTHSNNPHSILESLFPHLSHHASLFPFQTTFRDPGRSGQPHHNTLQIWAADWLWIHVFYMCHLEFGSGTQAFTAWMIMSPGHLSSRAPACNEARTRPRC